MDPESYVAFECNKCYRTGSVRITFGTTTAKGKTKILENGRRQLEDKHKQLSPTCNGKFRDLHVYGQSSPFDKLMDDLKEMTNSVLDRIRSTF